MVIYEDTSVRGGKEEGYLEILGIQLVVTHEEKSDQTVGINPEKSVGGGKVQEYLGALGDKRVEVYQEKFVGGCKKERRRGEEGGNGREEADYT